MDELWLVCGVTPQEIEAMPLDRFWYWHQRAVQYFGDKGGAAPRSAAQARHTQEIDHFVRMFRGG